MSYRFATPAQFDACLFERADRTNEGLRAFAPYAQPVLYPSNGAHAPAVTRGGEIVWRDDDGALHRITSCADDPEVSPAPFALARAKRIVASAGSLWVAGDVAGSLQRFEEDTLARLLTVEIPDARIVDIAGGGVSFRAAKTARNPPPKHDQHSAGGGSFAVYALLENKQVVQVSNDGRIVNTLTFDGLGHPLAFVILQRARQFVVLDQHGRQQWLRWFSAKGGAPLFSVPASFRPCLAASILGSDSRGRIFVGGGDFVLIFDAEGNPLGEIPLDAPATGIATTRDSLLVTGPRGLLRFPPADTVPDRGVEVRSTLMTPALHSPDREDARRWLRVEATATLPEGTTLEIAYASTDKQQIRDELLAIAADASLPASRRIEKLLADPDVTWTTTVFHGGTPQPVFAAPLFDITDAYLWVAVTLIAAPGARLPQLSELSILYPGRSLMENLPAIYRRAEAQPGSFLRSLVGVLETTTQGLDARIASMASHIHPSTAPEEWLDFVARWLGLPWDDALDAERKRAILLHAPELASGRGTRRGLEALLESLMPGTPRRFRVTDTTADYGFAAVGGTLPAMLGGYLRTRPELDAHARLGVMRLQCAGQLDDGVWQFAGTIRVEVAATAKEREAWEPWLGALIADMVPLTVRVQLRFVSAYALRSDRLDGTLQLEAAPTPHLGTDAVTGLAHLPEEGARLSTGAGIGSPLR
jgi:phage tail-like protein